MGEVLEPLLISLRVALVATALVGVPGIYLGWLLSRKRFFGRAILDGIVQLPLVLPAVAVGYFLLWSLGKAGLGLAPSLLFTWKGATLAAAIMALPLVVRMAKLAFDGVDPRLESMGRSLGFSPWRVIWRVTLPLARRGIGAALILGFGRALGEFGATIIVAGMVPGETGTLALAIFENIQLGHSDQAFALVAVASAVSFLAVAISGHLMGDSNGGSRNRGASRDRGGAQ
ncbi:MAG: molybdate transport system permease protein [Planctomycetota bacterium]|jgi:molybdate transport system permease protein